MRPDSIVEMLRSDAKALRAVVALAEALAARRSLSRALAAAVTP